MTSAVETPTVKEGSICLGRGCPFQTPQLYNWAVHVRMKPKLSFPSASPHLPRVVLMIRHTGCIAVRVLEDLEGGPLGARVNRRPGPAIREMFSVRPVLRAPIAGECLCVRVLDVLAHKTLL